MVCFCIAHRRNPSSSSYVLLITFNQNGAGVLCESERDGWDEEVFTYTCSSGVITFIVPKETEGETVRIVSLTSTKLVLKDIPDIGNCTFYKQ